ncbi:DUF3883 domain-containing protein [Hydrogenophaga pseudoflava]|jgi:hypothetical protein|uniref:Protein NO VEIN C-terminal domain-containing protein n=1 Tax=Hydrogenophaga pseudoflava TaxID=47421 RepID=A0A4P6WXI0_HYDPS|nr:DUF3883 domain-containing protein [Hydrogenophaga pseudoflava]QBM26041.1 hypothetical protein HPF_00030 [Hydrogenophaga pseudoflava]
MTSQDWNRLEVEAIVADYLKMLSLELAGQAFSKTAHRRALQQKLQGRTDGSIEFKHCNISAVMRDLGFPTVRGYQPRSNYQSLLREVVEAQVTRQTSLDSLALAAVEQPAVSPELIDFSKVVANAPKRQHVATDAAPYRDYAPVKRDYIAREARNTSLGIAGEEFVVRFEHWRLNQLGMTTLADRVEHVSQTKGDGLGYDVLSFDASGRERFIEVKTTAFGKETPFFVTRNELDFSKDAKDHFVLCRLFEFRQAPRLFALNGALDQHCALDPVTYRASFA